MGPSPNNDQFPQNKEAAVSNADILAEKRTDDLFDICPSWEWEEPPNWRWSGSGLRHW